MTVRVLDMQTDQASRRRGGSLAAAKETGAIVTAEEHTIIGGLGGAVAEFVSENYPYPWCAWASATSTPRPASQKQLMVAYGLTAENIARSVKRAIELKR